MNKKFTRTVENFVCERCGSKVVGDGYTNHCPKCLWSKHVDVHPGDRAETCKGAMAPISFEKKGEQYVVLQKCATCGFERKNHIGKADNIEVLIELSRGK